MRVVVAGATGAIGRQLCGFAAGPTGTWPGSPLAAPALPGAQQRELQALLTGAGKPANAHNFARTFSATVWYTVGALVAVFLGLFALPDRVRAQDTDTALPAAEPVHLQ
jgi:hypothetical protein